MSLRALSECSHAFGNASTATIAAVPATPGRRVCVYRIALSAAAAAGVTIQDTSGAALSQAFQWTATSVPLVIETQTNGDPLWMTTAGLGVQLGQSGTVAIGFDIWFMLQP